MNHPAITLAQKRARFLINFSLIYIVIAWITALTGFVEVPTDRISWVVLLSLGLLPFEIMLIIFLTLWMRDLFITSRFIQPEGFGYRQGWAFWSWVTPIAMFWIPRRIIEYTNAIFAEFTSNARVVDTKKWWFFWAGALAINYLSLPFASTAPEIMGALGVIKAILITVAFPYWRTVVEESTDAQCAAIEKLANQDQNRI